MESRHLWYKITNNFFGKFVGKDSLGNKYYESKKKGKRWVIYSGEIDASKFLLNGILGYILHQIKLRKIIHLKKYDWQKPHQPNLTGTKAAYYPNKNKDGLKKI